MKLINTFIKNRRPQQWSRALILLLIAAAAIVWINTNRNPVAAGNAAVLSVIELQTTNAPMLPGVLQAINNGHGDQFDPHVDCNLVSYTDKDLLGASRIRYFDFATNTDHLIPGDTADSLSDVSGGYIVFEQANTDGTVSGPRIGIFDVASQTRGGLAGINSPSIGGNFISFDDRLQRKSLPSDVGVYKIGVGAIARLSNDDLFDRNAVMSSTGNAVVWEKCQTNESGCDIYAAIQTSPNVFAVNALTGAEGEDRDPSTNGQIAVYTSNRNGETDIYIGSLAGNAETRLSISGDQRDPHIAGNLIVFQSQVQDGSYDVFVYDLGTGKLYRVTDTPVNETLNDITVCNDTGRLVYTAQAADSDVYAFTFQPPGLTANQVNKLIGTVQSFELSDGIKNSLKTKLQEALAAINGSDTALACDSLTAFINATQAQSGKKLTADQASQLISSANQIKTNLGCQ